MTQPARPRAKRPVLGALARRQHASPAKTAAGRLLTDFYPLLPSEQRLLSACRQGETAAFGVAVPEVSNDAVLVRAAFLRFLLLGGDHQAPVHEHGVHLAGAWVDGRLDLNGCCVEYNVLLTHCKLNGQLFARDARIRGLMALDGSCLLQGFHADRLQSDGGLFLRNGFQATGQVRLLGAQIGGNFSCRGGLFETNGTEAIVADRAVVRGSVFFTEGFKATGQVRMVGAEIGGELACRGGKFEVNEGEAVVADRIQVKGNVHFTDGFKVTGPVRMPGAQIGGEFVCSGGQFETEGIALLADGLVAGGDVAFSSGFKTTGEVRLLDAQIGRNLACSDGQFEVKKGYAISADRAVVRGGVFLTGSFRATGQVRLLGAQVGGNFSCQGGQFEVNEGVALSAELLRVGGNVQLCGGFKATGEVQLQNAQIGGNIECFRAQFKTTEGRALSIDRAVVKGSIFLVRGFNATGGVSLLGVQLDNNLYCSGEHFENKGRPAFAADRAVVRGGVTFSKGFKAIGQVRLLGARIGGDLSCLGGQFEVERGSAFSVQNAVIGGAWHLHQRDRPIQVDASHMQVAVLNDALESWADGSVLDGLRYGAFGGRAPTQARARVKWLRKQRSEHWDAMNDGEFFRPQPWRQLRHVLREMGHFEDARQIGIAFEYQLRRSGRIGRSSPDTFAAVRWGKRAIVQSAHALFGWLSGYGYRPMRLIGWMALVWLVCAVCYWRLALPPFHAIGPSDPLVFQNKQYENCVPGSPPVPKLPAGGAKRTGNWYLCESLPAEYSTFSPLAYSLDIILPFVDLGQHDSWGPLVPTPQSDPWAEIRAGSSGHVVRAVIWFETLFGWIGSALLVGIVSGFARRSEE